MTSTPPGQQRPQEPETSPARIQLSRAKGARLPPGARSVARPTRFGNPYKVAPHGPYTLADSLAATSTTCAPGG
jgi:hypothetical protein